MILHISEKYLAIITYFTLFNTITPIVLVLKLNLQFFPGPGHTQTLNWNKTKQKKTIFFLQRNWIYGFDSSIWRNIAPPNPSKVGTEETLLTFIMMAHWLCQTLWWNIWLIKQRLSSYFSPNAHSPLCKHRITLDTTS